MTNYLLDVFFTLPLLIGAFGQVLRKVRAGREHARLFNAEAICSTIGLMSAVCALLIGIDHLLFF